MHRAGVTQVGYSHFNGRGGLVNRQIVCFNFFQLRFLEFFPTTPISSLALENLWRERSLK